MCIRDRSNAIEISFPGIYPAFFIASTITSNASSSLCKFGANPPSSPTATEYPFAFNTFLDVYKRQVFL